MDKIRLLRCIHDSVYHDIRKDVYKENIVRVYYGFDSYNASVARINQVVEIVKHENPGIREEDMDVVFITRGMSNRHAHFTMICVARKASLVKDHLEKDYTIL